MERLERKRVGDIMYHKKWLYDQVINIAGRAVLTATPKIVDALKQGGFSVSKDLLYECFSLALDDGYETLPKDGYIAVTNEEAAAVSWPLLDEQIAQRTAGLNEFIMESAMDKLNTVKAKALGYQLPIRKIIFEKTTNSNDVLRLLFQVLEFKDGQLQYVSGYKERMDEFTTVRFKSQAAVDLYSQHVKVYEEMKKLYDMIPDSFAKKKLSTDFFVAFHFGEIGFEEGVDYEQIVNLK